MAACFLIVIILQKHYHFGKSYQDPFSDFQEEAQLNIGNKPVDLLEQTKEYCIMPWINKKRKFTDQKHATEYDIESYTKHDDR